MHVRTAVTDSGAALGSLAACAGHLWEKTAVAWCTGTLMCTSATKVLLPPCLLLLFDPPPVPSTLLSLRVAQQRVLMHMAGRRGAAVQGDALECGQAKGRAEGAGRVRALPRTRHLGAAGQRPGHTDRPGPEAAAQQAQRRPRSRRQGKASPSLAAPRTAFALAPGLTEQLLAAIREVAGHEGDGS